MSEHEQQLGLKGGQWETITQLVRNSKLVTDERHSFRITPDCLRIPKETIMEMAKSGKEIVDFFHGINDLLTLGGLRIIPSSIKSVINEALIDPLSKEERNTCQADRSIPRLFRVDAMVDTNGRILFAEIEGDKKHGFGFASLTKAMAVSTNQESRDDSQFLPGIVPSLAKLLDEITGTSGILVGDFESFYIPEQQFLSEQLNDLGARVEFMLSEDITITEEREVVNCRTNHPISALIDIPNLQDRDKEARLKELWRQGKLICLIPPKPVFGLKSCLALLFEPETKIFFEHGSLGCKTLTNHLPETRLFRLDQSFDPAKFVLKRVRSSGARGVAITDTGSGETLWTKAKKDSKGFIVQAKVEQQQFPVLFKENLDSSEIKQEDQFLRLAAFFGIINGKVKLLDISGTMRSVPDVHGKPDAVLLPIGVK